MPRRRAVLAFEPRGTQSLWRRCAEPGNRVMTSTNDKHKCRAGPGAARPAPPEEGANMTGFIEPVAGIGHNQPDPMEMEKKNQKWERWAKKRTFVRAPESPDSHHSNTRASTPRVDSSPAPP